MSFLSRISPPPPRTDDPPLPVVGPVFFLYLTPFLRLKEQAFPPIAPLSFLDSEVHPDFLLREFPTPRISVFFALREN